MKAFVDPPRRTIHFRGPPSPRRPFVVIDLSYRASVVPDEGPEPWEGFIMILPLLLGGAEQRLEPMRSVAQRGAWT